MSRISWKQNGKDWDEQNVTFVFDNEGHTLGNALKSIITNYPEVDFCGYTVGHQLDNRINFRIQTKGKATAVDVLRKGLQDLCFLCQHLIAKAEKALK